jgi:putative salt-induced outer membrane protein
MALAQDSKWSNESELSLIQTGGNTSLETYNLKTESSLKVDKSVYSFGGHYTLGSSEVEDSNDPTKTERKETARNWDIHGKYERVLSQKVNGFFAVMYEGNEFSGYKQRENFDFGGKYKTHETENFNSFFELGLRYTIESSLERDEDNEDVFKDTKGRTYYELNHKLNSGLSYKFWAEYISNFTRDENYLINFEPSVAFTLSDKFSLKLSYKGMYDNNPSTEGNEYLDWTYTTSLLAKF